MADVETTPPEALSARAKGIIYAKTITSRRAQQRRTKQQAKREQAEAEDGTSAQETLLTTEGERKRKRETAPSVPAKKSKVATTVTAAGPVLGPKVAVRETAPPTLAKTRTVAATAIAAVAVRGRKLTVNSHPTESAAHGLADLEARIVKLQASNDELRAINDKLRAQLARALAVTNTDTTQPLSPLNPLGSSRLESFFVSVASSLSPSLDPWRDVTTSPPGNTIGPFPASSGIDSESTVWGASAASPPPSVDPFRPTGASSSPGECRGIAVSPLNTATPITIFAAEQDVAPLWPTRDSVDDILHLLSAVEEDAEVAIERPTTPSTIADDDGTSSVWSVDSH